MDYTSFFYFCCSEVKKKTSGLCACHWFLFYVAVVHTNVTVLISTLINMSLNAVVVHTLCCWSAATPIRTSHVWWRRSAVGVVFCRVFSRLLCHEKGVDMALRCPLTYKCLLKKFYFCLWVNALALCQASQSSQWGKTREKSYVSLLSCCSKPQAEKWGVVKCVLRKFWH